jgi:hypothetical protein
MKIALKKWMLKVLSDLEEITKKHEKRIHLECKRLLLKRQVEQE